MIQCSASQQAFHDRRKHPRRPDFLYMGELSPWGRSFCPRTAAPGGGKMLRMEAPLELLHWGRPCHVTPGLSLLRRFMHRLSYIPANILAQFE